VRLVDEALEKLARRRLLRQIVFLDFDSATFQVGDRLAAAGSGRLEVHLDFVRHFFLTHHAFVAAPPASCGGPATGDPTGISPAAETEPRLSAGPLVAGAAARSASISRISGVQLPPQCPVVAPVLFATSSTVRAPSRIARSMVLYLMLLQRQMVFRPRIAGCRG
jgi:hypothetical protein